MPLDHFEVVDVGEDALGRIETSFVRGEGAPAVDRLAIAVLATGFGSHPPDAILHARLVVGDERVVVSGVDETAQPRGLAEADLVDDASVHEHIPIERRHPTLGPHLDERDPFETVRAVQVLREREAENGLGELLVDPAHLGQVNIEEHVLELEGAFDDSLGHLEGESAFRGHLVELAELLAAQTAIEEHAIDVKDLLLGRCLAFHRTPPCPYDNYLERALTFTLRKRLVVGKVSSSTSLFT